MDIIEQIIQQAEAGFSGVISIFQEDTVILNKAFGFRDVANHIANEVNTRFGIASGTKLFTALGIGKLIEQGQLSLQSTVAEINPDYGTFVDGRATIQQLLSHTSGIYDFYDEARFPDAERFFVDIPWYQLESNLDYLPLFEGQKPLFQPGERFSYSNGGFVFLGMLIEELAGMSFRDFIQQNILGPAQMTRSGFFAFNALPPNTATGYLSDGTTSNIYNLPIRGAGDGGMFTTTFDLQSFWHALFSYKIVNRNITEALLTTRYEFDAQRGYGCGIYKTLDDAMYAIVGGDAGVGFDSRYLPHERIVINILSNITDGEETMRAFIMSHLDQIIQQTA